MRDVFVLVLLLGTIPLSAKDLYCQSGTAIKSKVYMKISRLPSDLPKYMESLPKLNKSREPATDQMDEIMTKFFENKEDFTFSVRMDQSSFEDILVKPLLSGDWEGVKAIAFMTNPFKGEQIIKFQLDTKSFEGSLDYKGTHGNISKVQMNCAHEKTEGF